MRVAASGLEALHAELAAKGYGYLRPALHRGDDELELCLLDPFGNRITLIETL